MTDKKTEKKCPSLKVAGILTIIESAIMLLLVLIGLVASSRLIAMLSGGAMIGADIEGSGMIKVVLIVSLLVTAVLYILQIVGVSKSMKLKKGGFIMFLVVAALLSILLVYGLIKNFSGFSLGYLIFKLIMIALVVMGYKKSTKTA